MAELLRDAGLRDAVHRQVARRRPEGVPANPARLRPLSWFPIFQRHGRRSGTALPGRAAQTAPSADALVRDDKVIETMNGAKQDRIEQIYTDEAVKFIREHKAGPFFLYLAHTAVHVPLHPGAAFRGKSAQRDIWRLGRGGGRQHRARARHLRELKLADNTLVIFTSDNGPWLTQGRNGGTADPLRGGKGGTYEGGMREPTIAWWPGHIAPGTTSDAVAGKIDLLPTFVKLAGGAVPTDRKIDGVDILPLLLGQTKRIPPRRAILLRQQPAPGRPPRPVEAGHRPAARRKPPRRPAAADSKPPFPKLYNLDTDIGETHRRRRRSIPMWSNTWRSWCRNGCRPGGQGQRPRRPPAGPRG